MVGLVTATVIAAGSAYMSAKEAKKGSRAQQAANEAQRKINKLKNFQSKRQYLRNFRQAQANAFLSTVASGAGLGSSAAQSARSSQLAQAATASAEFERMDELGAEQTVAMNQASRYGARAQTWGAVSSFASQFIRPGGAQGMFKGA